MNENVKNEVDVDHRGEPRTRIWNDQGDFEPAEGKRAANYRRRLPKARRGQCKWSEYIFFHRQHERTTEYK